MGQTTHKFGVTFFKNNILNINKEKNFKNIVTCEYLGSFIIKFLRG